MTHFSHTDYESYKSRRYQNHYLAVKREREIRREIDEEIREAIQLKGDNNVEYPISTEVR